MLYTGSQSFFFLIVAFFWEQLIFFSWRWRDFLEVLQCSIHDARGYVFFCIRSLLVVFFFLQLGVETVLGALTCCTHRDARGFFCVRRFSSGGFFFWVMEVLFWEFWHAVYMTPWGYFIAKYIHFQAVCTLVQFSSRLVWGLKLLRPRPLIPASSGWSAAPNRPFSLPAAPPPPEKQQQRRSSRSSPK